MGSGQPYALGEWQMGQADGNTERAEKKSGRRIDVAIARALELCILGIALVDGQGRMSTAVCPAEHPEMRGC